LDEFESFSQTRLDRAKRRRIGVIGCGMIGGSIALSLSESGNDVFVVDLPQNEKRIMKQIPSVSIIGDVQGICELKPDVIFLCVPSDKTPEILSETAKFVLPGTVVTDVAGVKFPIMNVASESIPDDVIFVGGHPMAGSEKSGVEAAQPFLFQNAVYVLSPLRDYSHEQMQPLLEVVEQLGARILFMDALQHDKIAAAISHLPQIIAVELVNLISELSVTDENFSVLAAGGFRDMTRIASSDFSVWRDVIISNRANIANVLKAFLERLVMVNDSISEEDIGNIAHEFEMAKSARTKIPKGGKGFLKPLYDLYVVVEDKVGVLKEITSSLADCDINIKDIELLKVREGMGGMFRLSFDTEQILDNAARILEQRGFQILRKEFEG
jgi:prephenate dehydrogenase